MSWEATAWAKKTRGHRSHGCGRLLLILAECHNSEKGIAWPSQKYLAENCEMPERTVRWCLSILEKQGFITVLQKGNQYQPTQYQLNFDLATAPSYEPARSEPARIAAASEPARLTPVNRQDGASEPATPRHTNQQEQTVIEPTTLSSIPEWFQTLSEDSRWTGKNSEKYITTIEKEFPGINLDLESHSAYEWLQSEKGKKKKVLRGFWRNWLKNATKENSSNGNQPTVQSESRAALAKYDGNQWRKE